MAVDTSFVTSNEVLRYVQQGNILDFLNDTGSEIKAGTHLTPPGSGSKPTGITVRNIPDGALGSYRANVKAPVWEGPLDPAATDDFQVGDAVYWNATNSILVPAGGNSEGATADTLLGWAVSGAGGAGGSGEQHNGWSAADGAAAGGDDFIRFVLVN